MNKLFFHKKKTCQREELEGLTDNHFNMGYNWVGSLSTTREFKPTVRCNTQQTLTNSFLRRFKGPKKYIARDRQETTSVLGNNLTYRTKG